MQTRRGVMERLDRFESRWRHEVAELLSGMKEWRVQHPKARFREIEAAVDERLSGMRTRLLQDLALASAAADLAEQAADERPTCPACGGGLHARGTHQRTLLTQGGQPLHLTRRYATCSACGAGLFPPG